MALISFTYSMPQLQLLFFIFLRIGAIILTAPVFDSPSIPVLFKAGLAFAVSLLLMPILNLEAVSFQPGLLPFIIGALGEVIMGFMLGIFVRILFAGIVLAGQMVGYQMGLAMANIMDPATSEQVPLLGQFNNLMAMLIFLVTDAHHLFVKAMVASFQIIPPYGFHFNNAVMDQLISVSGEMFLIGIRLGAPLIAVLLLMSVAFGLANRAVPQMNIFFVAGPLKIIVGLLFMVFSLPYMSAFMAALVGGLGQRILGILNAI
ncbi:MAG: flagellar biosynthetic protein FliR [Deltaproteobacteria bacterium]|nr:flagellar biosynthetic protein FliR [Deltaproteobacteria bacterium]